MIDEIVRYENEKRIKKMLNKEIDERIEKIEEDILDKVAKVFKCGPIILKMVSYKEMGDLRVIIKIPTSKYSLFHDKMEVASRVGKVLDMEFKREYSFENIDGTHLHYIGGGI